MAVLDAVNSLVSVTARQFEDVAWMWRVVEQIRSHATFTVMARCIPMACIHERLKDCHRIHNHTIKGVKLQMVNKDVLIMDNRRCLSEEASEK